MHFHGCENSTFLRNILCNNEGSIRAEHGINDDIIENIFITLGTLQVLTNSDTKFEAGEKENITWETTGDIKYVDIDLYKGDTLKYSVKNVSNLEEKK